MTRPLIPFVQNGYYASRNWIPLVKGNGFTTSGGGEQEEVWETSSGSIVTFNAVAAPLRQLSVAVEPVQNLNGYDHPWPAGGGKNLLDTSSFASGSYNSVTLTRNADGTISLSGTASSTINLNGTPFTLPAGTYTLSGSISNNQLYLYDQGTNTVIVESPNGTTRTVTTTEDKTAYLRLRVGGESTVSGTVKPQLELGSTATVYSPYSNICPITGWNSVTVNRTGVNVWDEEMEVGRISTSNGQNESTTNRLRSKNYIPVTPSTTYYFLSNNVLAEWFEYDANKNFLRYIRGDIKNSVFTTGSDCYYRRFVMYSTYGTTYNNDISINYPATDTEYHAYQGNIYTIQLGETVYGGTLDVVNGKMTVDSRYFVADGTNITTTGGYGAAGANWLPCIVLPSGSKAASTAVDVLADSLKTTTFVGSVENSISIGNSGAVIALHIGTMQGTNGAHGYNSAAEVHAAVKTYLQSNPIGIWYRLATPFELTLTPEQISTLRGTNNVWSDAGDVTVEYRAQ